MTSVASTSRKLFVNLAIADLARTTAFWKRLGFTFNQQFTDENGTCMILSEEAYVMWLVRPFFQTFTKKQICDSSKASEALLCISAESRAAVDELVNTALSAGGSPAMPPMDMGFMYGWSFYDIDGHHWEVMWMDPSHIQKA